MKKILMSTLLFFCFSQTTVKAQNPSNEDQKIVLITLDGFRWQELFSGADPDLIANKKYVSDTTALKEKFWRKTAESRRRALLPFIWSTVKANGQLHGNRKLGSNVNLTNQMWFSYPGYNEILTGAADDEHINSNNKIPNPNITILEKLNNTKKYAGKVAAFGSWDVFPYIINEKRSRIPVNAGYEIAKGKNLTEIEKFLNRIQPQTPSPFGAVRFDVFTHNYALEYMKRKHPKIVYIAYGLTDDFAHHANYEAYLKAAKTTDDFLKELWEFTQNNPFYKDKTTFIVTTDHGRGDLEKWTSHGSNVEGAGNVWLMLFGKDIEHLGEISTEEQLYSTDVVKKIKELLEIPK